MFNFFGSFYHSFNAHLFKGKKCQTITKCLHWNNTLMSRNPNNIGIKKIHELLMFNLCYLFFFLIFKVLLMLLVSHRMSQKSNREENNDIEVRA